MGCCCCRRATTTDATPPQPVNDEGRLESGERDRILNNAAHWVGGDYATFPAGDEANRLHETFTTDELDEMARCRARLVKAGLLPQPAAIATTEIALPADTTAPRNKLADSDPEFQKLLLGAAQALAAERGTNPPAPSADSVPLTLEESVARTRGMSAFLKGMNHLAAQNKALRHQ